MITSSCVKLMEWCFKSLGGVVNHATLQKTHTQTILLATGRNYPYTKHNWAFHILLRSITFPLARDFLDCLPGSPRSFSSNFSHLCLSAADITTSFQRHKWPQTKTYTNSDTVFWHSISCPRCYLFCYWWWHLKPFSDLLFFSDFLKSFGPSMWQAEDETDLTLRAKWFTIFAWKNRARKFGQKFLAFFSGYFCLRKEEVDKWLCLCVIICQAVCDTI